MDRHEVDRLSSMLFNYGSTSRTDYQKPEIVPHVKDTIGKKIKRKRRDFVPISYVESMTGWKDTPVPLSLFIRQDTITRYDPRVKQSIFVPIAKDQEHEEARKTRPRLVMTPAASLDDVDDPIARDIMIKDIYTSSLTAAQKPAAEAAFPVDKNVKSPLGDACAPPKPCELKKLQPPYVSKEWRWESVSWDLNQMRGYALPTKEFWLDRIKSRQRK